MIITQNYNDVRDFFMISFFLADRKLQKKRQSLVDILYRHFVLEDKLKY